MRHARRNSSGHDKELALFPVLARGINDSLMLSLFCVQTPCAREWCAHPRPRAALSAALRVCSWPQRAPTLEQHMRLKYGSRDLLGRSFPIF